MIDRRKRRKGMARTEIANLRLDPRTYFLLELAARIQRRGKGNLIEWLIVNEFSRVLLPDGRSISEAADELWSINEEERLLRIQELYPSLLSFDEELALAEKCKMGTSKSAS